MSIRGSASERRRLRHRALTIMESEVTSEQLRRFGRLGRAGSDGWRPWSGFARTHATTEMVTAIGKLLTSDRSVETEDPEALVVAAVFRGSEPELDASARRALWTMQNDYPELFGKRDHRIVDAAIRGLAEPAGGEFAVHEHALADATSSRIWSRSGGYQCLRSSIEEGAHSGNIVLPPDARVFSEAEVRDPQGVIDAIAAEQQFVATHRFQLPLVQAQARTGRLANADRLAQLRERYENELELGAAASDALDRTVHAVNGIQPFDRLRSVAVAYNEQRAEWSLENGRPPTRAELPPPPLELLSPEAAGSASGPPAGPRRERFKLIRLEPDGGLEEPVPDAGSARPPASDADPASPDAEQRRDPDAVVPPTDAVPAGMPSDEEPGASPPEPEDVADPAEPRPGALGAPDASEPDEPDAPSSPSDWTAALDEVASRGGPPDELPEWDGVPDRVEELTPEPGGEAVRISKVPPHAPAAKRIGQTPPHIGEMPPQIGERPAQIGKTPPQIGETPAPASPPEQISEPPAPSDPVERISEPPDRLSDPSDLDDLF